QFLALSRSKRRAAVFLFYEFLHAHLLVGRQSVVRTQLLHSLLIGTDTTLLGFSCSGSSIAALLPLLPLA
ncbi:MAG TPA: hypothetical protein VLQ80_28190, partial [Candidatus Saccharimonadia bacterium]|nr:hypothetical protein [Candidatus Saccharimonadia bacterium]